MGGGEEVVVVRIKEGRCPGGARCVSIGRVTPRRVVDVPEGDYLVVMSPAAALAVDIESLRRKFRCVICIGPSTAEAVGGCVVPREYTSYGVVKLLESMAPGRVVVLRSSMGNDVLKKYMRDVVEVPVYDVEIDREKLVQYLEVIKNSRAVVLTSSNVAEAVAAYLDLRGKVVVAIGPVTSSKLRELGVQHYTAPEATIESAVSTAFRLLQQF
ncbi:MAG: uroporphyrinogen-III synthase [Pyrobaculum sp.]